MIGGLMELDRTAWIDLMDRWVEPDVLDDKTGKQSNFTTPP